MLLISPAAAETATAEILGWVDQLVLPHIELPKADLGDGVLADAGEVVLNAGGSLAGRGVEAILDKLQGAIDSVKGTLRGPAVTARFLPTRSGPSSKLLISRPRR